MGQNFHVIYGEHIDFGVEPNGADCLAAALPALVRNASKLGMLERQEHAHITFGDIEI
jgi:hypothetical protein